MHRAWAWCGLVGLSLMMGCDGDSEAGSGGAGASATTSGDAPTTSGPGGPGATTTTNSSTTGTGGSAPNLEPVFVAIGAGAWAATTCDRGQTWSTSEFSPDREDHSEWSAFGGLAFGNDAFVMATGWGFPGHVIRSADGVIWQDLDDAAFPGSGFDSSVGGVVFDGASFLLFGSSIWSSADGSTWTVTGNELPPGSNQLRQLRAFPTGLIVASVETQYGDDHSLGNWITVSSDGGTSWSEGTGYDAACGNPIQHWGDIELKDGVLLVGAETLCRSTDLGQTWSTVETPNGESIRDLFADATYFYAASGSRIFRSADGTSWEEAADLGTEIAKGSWGGGAYVAMNGDGTRVFYSGDGSSWDEGTISTALTPTIVRDLGVGYFANADACP